MRKFVYFCAVVAGVIIDGSLICAQDSSSAAAVDATDARKQCPNDNEVYDSCPTLCPARTCGIDDTAALCGILSTKDCLKPGCRCKDGLYRDDKGNCVPWDKCPQCPPNMQYDPCDESCGRRRCDFDPTIVKCPLPPTLGDPRCIARCRCIDGYSSNANGTCIPSEECPCKGDENAVRGCGTKCGQLCSDVGSKRPPICNPDDCVFMGCDCRKGFYYDSVSGKCVPPEKCKPQCTANEVFSECANGCQKKICRDLISPSSCVEPKECKPGCLCANGYLQSDNGTCIPIASCPGPVCKENEVLSSCAGAGCKRWRCGEDVLCVDTFTCTPGCDCAEGYVWDDNMRCIPEKDCPNSPLNCKENQIYSTCANIKCIVKSCSEVNSTTVCIPVRPRICLPGCICDKGYYQDPKGNCVPPEKCPHPPESCKRNEVLSDCANSCTIKKSCKDITNPPLCVAQEICNPGCICAEGYLRDDNGDCVPIEKCPVKCSENEVLSSCANGGCRRRTCADPGILCIDPRKCEPGCICAEGYVLDNNKKCIPEKQCNATVCIKQNEVFDPCDAPCPQRTCDFNPALATCVQPPMIGDPRCITGCRCKDGYLRDSNGVCIPAQECPPRCPQNEVYSGCVNGCQKKTCRDLAFPTDCVEPSRCNKGCVCADGYLRDDKGICVPTRSCPEPTCKENEILSSCANSGCRRWSCADPGILCIDPFKCEPGCICAEGYVWDDRKRCISEKECPNSQSCKENEILSPCANRNCEIKTCANLTNPVRCIEQGTKECVAGCVCAEGYYKDADGNCVPPEKCPPTQTCKRNEVFSTCINSCGRKNCKDLTKPLICTDIKGCISGCVCAEGYLLDDNGECIPIEKCPAVSCDGDENAQYGCSLNCGKLCSDLNSTRPICPKVCPSAGCECKDGFYYDSTVRKCVRPEQCIPVSCGGDPNAEPGCGANCGKQCGDVRNIDGEIVPCRDFCTLDGCDCKRGFYLNPETKRCVRAEECPITCKTNEEYNECKNGICVWENCEDRGKDIKCPPIIIDRCDPGCVCQKKYFRRNGVCIPEEQCDIKCQENQVVSACANGGCRRRKCEDLNESILCIYPRTCISGCICAKGYLMNKDGKCIAEEQCRKEIS